VARAIPCMHASITQCKWRKAAGTYRKTMGTEMLPADMYNCFAAELMTCQCGDKKYEDWHPEIGFGAAFLLSSCLNRQSSVFLYLPGRWPAAKS
jgi:hypothetical protein